MKKCENMDIPSPLELLRWLQSFLLNRKQRVEFGCTLSTSLEIRGAIPQGTLLGVLCILGVLINDPHTDCATIKYVMIQ